jgi:hypothetical protein
MTEAEAKGLVGAATTLGSKLIGSLPAQFMVLVLINAVFLLGLLWFLDQRDEARERLLTPVLASCIHAVPIELVERLIVLPQPANKELPK